MNNEIICVYSEEEIHNTSFTEILIFLDFF